MDTGYTRLFNAVKFALRPFRDEPRLWEVLKDLRKRGFQDYAKTETKRSVPNKKERHWKPVKKVYKGTSEVYNYRCPECHSTLRMAEGCKVCDNCGWSACT